MSDESRAEVRPERPRGTDRRSAAERLAELDELELQVEKLVTGGLGLGRFEGIAIFVPLSVPGDRLRVRVVERRPDYGRAEILEILEPGPGRREAPCPYFASCGGCDFQHIDDDLQPRLKTLALRETLERVGGIEWPEESELIRDEPWSYRLRCQLHSSGEPGERIVLGYHARGSRDVVEIEDCPILVPELRSEIAGLSSRLGEKPPKRLDIAAGDDGRWTTAPRVEGLPHGEITIEVGEFDYVFDARCFFQANRKLLPRLVEAVVGDERGKSVYDLYSGVGLYSLPLARLFDQVVAVEGDRIAARHARNTARRHGVENLQVLTQSIETFAKKLPAHLDRVVVNPPRSGLSGPVRAALLKGRPRRLTYVSCNPATLARDLKVLGSAYGLLKLAVLDLFPQTSHIETVAQLELRADGEDTEVRLPKTYVDWAEPSTPVRRRKSKGKKRRFGG